MYPPWTTPEDAARILQNGGIVAIPTETVYGLAGNAYDAKALAKIFEAKKRPHFDPLIVHIAALEELSHVASEIPEMAKKLAEAYWPGPLTLVLPKTERIPELATSGLPTVAVRFPSHPIAQQIIRLAKVPLAAPSANLFQHVSPTSAEHVAEQLGELIDGIVDGGPCGVGVESTIVAFTEKNSRHPTTRRNYSRNDSESHRQRFDSRIQIQSERPDARPRNDRPPLPSASSPLLRRASSECQTSKRHRTHCVRASNVGNPPDFKSFGIRRCKRSRRESLCVHASAGQSGKPLDSGGSHSKRRRGNRLQRQA